MSDFAQIRFLPNRPLLRELSADRLNTILQEIKRNKPKGERGITVRQDGTGTYIGLAAKLSKEASGTATKLGPWDITATSNPQNPNGSLLSVQPGTLNGILPINWNTIGASGAKEVPVANNAIIYCKAVLTTDGRDITNVAVSINSTPPIQQQANPFAIDDTIDVLFGLFFNGSIHRVIGNGHITVTPSVWMFTDKDSPAAAGELPYNIYYRLQ
jgi:hypothetical protein